MTFNEFCVKVSKAPKRHRKGEFLFKVLQEEQNDLARQLMSASCNPFADDSKIHECLKWLKERWVNG